MFSQSVFKPIDDCLSIDIVGMNRNEKTVFMNILSVRYPSYDTSIDVLAGSALGVLECGRFATSRIVNGLAVIDID